ncbi:MAG: LCP family protein [Candidatus Aquicultor sp.]|nr:LCP family protein [Candidatus Aquicultor sp.]
MYEGKHSTGKPRKRDYVRVFTLWALMIILFIGAGSFVFARILEERIHGPRAAQGADEDFVFNAPEDNEPVTFLLLGSDTRGGENEQGLSDTIMVLRVNPEKKIGYLISIPRDTRVEIPGKGKRKINAAYKYGGADLMVETVEDFLGLDINHYAVIDFQGFREIIDALGGIDIDVEKRLVDSRHQIDIRPGYQHLDGVEALKYVRIRRGDDDFGRIARQQKFLKAVMDKLLRVSSLLRIPQLADITSRNVTTDPELGVTQMIGYGKIFKSLGRKNLHMVVVPGTPQVIGGGSYVVPDEGKLAWILERVRADLPLELTEEEKENLNIRVEVQNGSGKAGIAHKMANKLGALNFKIHEVGNAQSFTYYDTQIIASEEKAELARRVQSKLGFGRVVIEGPSSETIDVLVIVGRDYSRMIGESDEE